VAAGTPTSTIFGRIHTDVVNRTKIPTIFDYAFGQYISNQTFFDELSRIQSELILKGEVRLKTGLVAKLDQVGGLLALQLHMESLNAAKDAMNGLSQLGLKNENKLWTLQ